MKIVALPLYRTPLEINEGRTTKEKKKEYININLKYTSIFMCFTTSKIGK
jgi:hypothetical protein